MARFDFSRSDFAQMFVLVSFLVTWLGSVIAVVYVCVCFIIPANGVFWGTLELIRWVIELPLFLACLIVLIEVKLFEAFTWLKEFRHGPPRNPYTLERLP